jgi:hypothetical protein
VIKDGDISDHKSIENVDFESMKDEHGNLLSHIIVISDDIRQFHHEVLQSLRSEEKITVVLLKDTYEKGDDPKYRKTSSDERHLSDIFDKPLNSNKINNQLKQSLNEQANSKGMILGHTNSVTLISPN